VGPHFHGTTDQFELYALERLADSEFARLEEHLIVCATCRCRFDEVEAYATGMREALVTDAEKGPDSGVDLLGWLRRPAVSMALGLIVLIAAISLVSRGPAKLAANAALDLPASSGTKAVAPPTRELDVTINDALRDSGPFRVEVVTPAGQTVWNGLAALGPLGVEVKVQQRMTAGDYFLRVYSASGEKLREYGFRIGT
jgi:hypothetical protein